MGYYKAGFKVTGVDIEPQPAYPFEFHQMNAIALTTKELKEFDAVHVSPPCQNYSVTAGAWNANPHSHPDLIAAFRFKILRTNKPYIIENVVQAPLLNPTMLCGSMFDLAVERHRNFEANFRIAPLKCDHVRQWLLNPEGFPAYGDKRQAPARVVSVFGKGGGLKDTALWQWAMQIDWMDKNHDLAQAIPPVYTQYIGQQLKAHITRQACKADRTPSMQGSSPS